MSTKMGMIVLMICMGKQFTLLRFTLINHQIVTYHSDSHGAIIQKKEFTHC